jgi:hypothetical protein
MELLSVYFYALHKTGVAVVADGGVYDVHLHLYSLLCVFECMCEGVTAVGRRFVHSLTHTLPSNHQEEKDKTNTLILLICNIIETNSLLSVWVYLCRNQ